MSKATFIFISCLFLLLPFVLSADKIESSYQLIICTPFILFLGIPHGAIDNVLYLRDKRMSNAQFISVYLIIIGLNVLLWWAFPSFSYILFLILSAYHFGQSQFNHYFQKQSIPHLLLFIFWGITILSSLIYFNLDEIYLIMESTPEFAVFDPLHQRQDMLYVLLGSCSITLFIMLFLAIKRSLMLYDFMIEVLVLALILVSFYFMPLIIGFTLYFVILHSFKVLREEYGFLAAQKEANSITQFIKMVAPFTLFSIAGILILFAAIYFQFLNLTYGYCLLIVISSITLPHVYVMNKFYLIFRGVK
ncbi:MAG: Brp/Blh family beta-carotene 15,15'-dioxygenase [Salibacteraceae bacterium]|nr:Brp/Blh family beta-carotene 15,15'-dioxygenase [Salibacteraceae bacterium]